MYIRIRKTGQVLEANAWMAWAEATYKKSFSGLTLTAIHNFDSDPLLESPTPTTAEGEHAEIDGAQMIDGQWFTKYKLVKEA